MTYFNAATDQAWALEQAVEAWNRSGAWVRFSPAPRSEAMVTIEDDDSAQCTRATAVVGRSNQSRVVIWRRDDRRPGCDGLSAALALTHELGHVLGLTHDESRCATMNPRGGYRGPEHCPQTRPDEWYCRLLQPSDVGRAIALYGGEASRVRPTTACPLGGGQTVVAAGS